MRTTKNYTNHDFFRGKDRFDGNEPYWYRITIVIIQRLFLLAALYIAGKQIIPVITTLVAFNINWLEIIRFLKGPT